MSQTLEQLLETHRQLIAAGKTLEKTFLDVTSYYETNVAKLLGAMDQIQQGQAKALQEVSLTLDKIIRK